MTISFERALGIHAQALDVRVNRAEVLANNLANADTPGYQARDLDFKAVLRGEVDQQLNLETSHGKHLPLNQEPFAGQLKYRVPLQASLDGNTVDTQQEVADFTKNVLDFQASFRFLNSKFQGLSKALKGE